MFLIATVDTCQSHPCHADADCTDNSQTGRTCACKQDFHGDGLKCLPKGGPGTPCPSDCWQFDAETGECSLPDNSDCFELTCGYDKIDLNFESRLFNVGDQDVEGSGSTVEPFGADNAPEFSTDAGKWVMNCTLGECGMDAVEDNG